MSSLVQSGLVQYPPMNNQINSNMTSTSSSQSFASSSSTITTDFDVFPVGTSINPTNFIYDGQTILNINSTLSPNSNLIKGQYFNPITGAPDSNLNSWNYDLTATSFLNGSFTTSALLNETTSLYNNLLPYNNSTGTYILDITNGGIQATGNSKQTLFFSLTSQPYVCSEGTFITTPNATNVIPAYSGNNSDNFIFTSNYYIQQKNEIIIVQLVFSVSNTDSLNVNNTTSLIYHASPTVSVIVTNKIISQNQSGSLSSGVNNGTKTYTSGPIPLQYAQNGVLFNPSNATSSIVNNVPLIIAPGYSTLYVTMPLAYIPPYLSSTSGNYVGQYLNQGTSTSGSAPSGYEIFNNIPVFPSSSLNTLNTTPVALSQTYSGHFVVGIAYSIDFSYYNPGSFIYSEVLIKNIWRSPISIYNSYKAFSVNDMATKLVVVLFGKGVNGGTFLILNTGTPLNLITSYGVTSLTNFMSIMKALINFYDGSVVSIDYFINTNVIQQVNTLGNYNIQVVTVQPILDGTIVNPPTVLNCPNSYYMLLNTKNSTNLSIDPTDQKILSYPFSNSSYFSISKGIPCATGICLYNNSELTLLQTNGTWLFANSLYLGQNTINGQTFYTLIILPEALFIGTPVSSLNQIYIYSSPYSLFYLSSSSNTATKFSPSNFTITSGTPSTTANQTSYSVSKLIMSVSNVSIIN